MNEKTLHSFGFTQYEAKVYLALASLPKGKAGEIGKISGVPSNKVYECLIRLAEKGFVASLNITPQEYKVTGVQKFRDMLKEQEQEIK